MREILFRGKRLDNGEWVYGFLYGMTDGWENGHYFIHDWYQSLPHEVDPATVGQYTGLKDKNGQRIWEGDIVVQDCYLWFDNGRPNYRGTVEWIYSQWQVIAHCINPNKGGISDGMNQGLNDDGFDDGVNSDWEIIGNIHDNPDLLKEEYQC